MNTYYIDESGSMTKKGLKYISNQYFIICIIVTNDNKKLKKIYKRFVSSNMEDLKNEDKHHTMFYKNGKFKELKGSIMSYGMKKRFVQYFCRNDLFSIFYVCSSNNLVQNHFYNNKARAFNYLLRISIYYNTINKNIHKDINYLYIDERNIRTETLYTLSEYLNIELCTVSNVQKSFCVQYCQSEFNDLIQVADVFSNIYFSYIVKGNKLNDEINYMRKNNYIKNEFYFP